MYRYEDIRTIHLEVTQNCQAACPMCDRNMNGEGINPHINLDELSLEDCKNIFSPRFIKQLNTMYMCGNLGDPIVAKDTLDEAIMKSLVNKGQIAAKTLGEEDLRNWLL